MKAKRATKSVKQKSVATSAFQLAARAAGLDASTHFALGLGAVQGCYRSRIQSCDVRRLRGSLDIDSALASLEPNNHRWDYAIGFQLANNGPEVAVWVEFHPAVTSEVDTVLNKLEWLRRKLSTLQLLSRLTEAAGANGIKCFHWLPTGSGVHIPAHTPQAKKLAAKGLTVTASTLRLP